MGPSPSLTKLYSSLPGSHDPGCDIDIKHPEGGACNSDPLGNGEVTAPSLVQRVRKGRPVHSSVKECGAEQASAGPYASYERIPAAQSCCYGSLGSKFPSCAVIGPPDPPQLLPMVSAL
jgi:hypothetical protein